MDLSVRVTVSFRSEPERVRDVLGEAARGCPAVAAGAGPVVLLADFAENGYAFEVRARAAPGQAIEEASSALRFAIVGAFRTHGIEIAVPQSDVRWRDLDFFRQAIMLAAQRRPASQVDESS